MDDLTVMDKINSIKQLPHDCTSTFFGNNDVVGKIVEKFTTLTTKDMKVKAETYISETRNMYASPSKTS